MVGAGEFPFDRPEGRDEQIVDVTGLSR